MEIVVDFSEWMWYSGTMDRLTCQGRTQHAMPRKPQPPMDLVIEGLSSGRRQRNVDAVDDFTGQPIERYIAQPNKHRRLPTANELALRAAQIKHKRDHERMQRTAKALTKVITDMIDPPKHKPFKRRV